jgi:hypothetical protein
MGAVDSTPTLRSRASFSNPKTGRHVTGGGTFGVQGLREAIARAEHATAARTAMAIQHAIIDALEEPLEDEATVVVLAVG